MRVAGWWGNMDRQAGCSSGDYAVVLAFMHYARPVSLQASGNRQRHLQPQIRRGEWNTLTRNVSDSYRDAF